MKEYSKPYIEEEVIELEDVIAASNGGQTKDGVNFDWPFDPEEE